MLWIAGTLPQALGVVCGRVSASAGGGVRVGDVEVEPGRGTGALLAAAVAAKEVVGGEVWAWVAGDDGSGEGSRRLWQVVAEEITSSGARAVVGHYIMPEADGHTLVMAALEQMQSPPLMLGDAGFMYAAKFCGMASAYELFTPDWAELAFLADPGAPHPFYAHLPRHQSRELAARAWKEGAAARVMLVKGRVDLVVEQGRVVGEVGDPVVEAMEAIGGTGDSLMGMAAVLVASGMATVDSALAAARANRLMGLLASPTPASPVRELIRFLPRALEQALGG